MRLMKKNQLILPVAYLTIILFSLKIQSDLFMSWDVTYMLQAASKMLAGGSYTQDYFNPNPPMAFILYMPVNLISQWFNLNIYHVFIAYIYTIAAVSLYLTSRLAKSLFVNAQVANYFVLTLCIAYLITPLYELGQREHLVVMLIFPYLLLLALRANQYIPKAGQVYLAGVLAAIGFSIKPYFLLIFIAGELYSLAMQRTLKSMLRPEAVCIYAIVVTHILYTIVFHPDYYSVIMPTLMRRYYAAVGSRLESMLLFPFIIATLITYLIVIYNKHNKSNKNIRTVLLLALTGFVLIYLLQQTTFYYHILPLAMLLLSILYLEIAEDVSRITCMIVAIPVILFSHDIYLCYLNYSGFKGALSPLVEFLNENASKKPVMFMMTQVSVPFVAVAQAGNPVAQRFDCLWLAAGLANTQGSPHWNEDREFYTRMITEDVSRNKPSYVFIDVRMMKQYINDYKFNYLTWLKLNNDFNEEWRHYKWKTTLAMSPVYILDVYERIT